MSNLRERAIILFAAVIVLLPGQAAETNKKYAVSYIANFRQNTGAYPTSEPILASDQNFYGVLPNLARNDVGSIYRVTPDGQLTVLHRFKGSDGAHPTGRLLQARDGALYGTTSSGGREKGCGTIFRLALDGSFSTLHVFNCGKHGGGTPSGGLIEAQNGLLYGLTQQGGNHGDGTVYMLTLEGEYTVVASFSSAFSGAKPKGELIQTKDGTFFGVASEGGAHGGGTLFSMSSDGVLKRERAFDGGANPNSGLAYASDTDTVYGTLSGGVIYYHREGQVRGFSTVFFGDSLEGGLTLAPDGVTLYGFCASSEGGCLYTIEADRKPRRLVGHLKGNPAGRPIFDQDGLIVGATQLGGSANRGTIFTVEPQ